MFALIELTGQRARQLAADLKADPRMGLAELL